MKYLHVIKISYLTTYLVCSNVVHTWVLGCYMVGVVPMRNMIHRRNFQIDKILTTYLCNISTNIKLITQFFLKKKHIYIYF